MPVFTDQLNRQVNLPHTPKRITSLVPSQTELLFFLGLREEVVGITKFCIHPADQIKHIAKIGGTKQLDMQVIRQLQPDLVIANKEENDREQVEELMQQYPVWISDVNDLLSAQQMIAGVGAITSRKIHAERLNQNITNEFAALRSLSSSIKVAYFIWRKPYMVAGTDTYIDSMLQLCGLKNVFKTSRYPEISHSQLVEANPQVILLSSEPYPFAQKHIDEFHSLLPTAKILLVDGEMFSWYGSRLSHAPAYFNTLINQLQLL